jgi:hypothetical protein
MRTIRTAALSFVLGTTMLCAVPRAASAQEHDANGLGDKGQLIISVDRLMPVLSYSSQTETSTNNGITTETTQSGTSIALLLGNEPNLGVVHTLPRVAFDYTIINHLTLGGSLAVAFGLGGGEEISTTNRPTVDRDAKRSIIGFAPRVGYIIPLHKNFAFWPRLGLSIYSVSTTFNRIQGNADVKVTNSDTLFAIDVDPQFVWTPIQHFFFQFGPLMNIPITGSRSSETDVGNSSTTQKNDLSVFHLGISAGLGGWFDL